MTRTVRPAPGGRDIRSTYSCGSSSGDAACRNWTSTCSSPSASERGARMRTTSPSSSRRDVAPPATGRAARGSSRCARRRGRPRGRCAARPCRRRARAPAAAARGCGPCSSRSTVRSRTSESDDEALVVGHVLADGPEQVHVDGRGQPGELEVAPAARGPAARPPSGAGHAGCGPRPARRSSGSGRKVNHAERSSPSRAPHGHRDPFEPVGDAPEHGADLLRGTLRVGVGRLARDDVEVEQRGGALGQLADQPAQVALHRPAGRCPRARPARCARWWRARRARRAARGCSAAVSSGRPPRSSTWTSVSSRIR